MLNMFNKFSSLIDAFVRVCMANFFSYLNPDSSFGIYGFFAKVLSLQHSRSPTMRLLTIVSLLYLQLIDGQLFNLKCNYTEASRDYYNRRICNSVDLDVGVLDQVLDSVDGEKTVLEDVVGLHIEEQIFRYVPYFLDVYLPKLLQIHIISSELRLINKYDLEPFPNLQELVLSNNELQFLDGDLFTLSTKIKYVQLEDNNLFVINGPIFKPIKLLTWVMISLPCMYKECFSNDCIPETLHEFRQYCEYDSIYPGFQEYFKFWMRTVEECEDHEREQMAQILNKPNEESGRK